MRNYVEKYKVIHEDLILETYVHFQYTFSSNNIAILFIVFSFPFEQLNDMLIINFIFVDPKWL